MYSVVAGKYSYLILEHDITVHTATNTLYTL